MSTVTLIYISKFITVAVREAYCDYALQNTPQLLYNYSLDIFVHGGNCNICDKYRDILWHRHFTVQIRFTRCLTTHVFNLVLVYSASLGLLQHMHSLSRTVVKRLPSQGKGTVDRYLDATAAADTHMDSYNCRCLVYTRNSSTDVWCWTVEKICAVEQFNRDVLLNRPQNRTQMCCWTAEERRDVEQVQRDVLLNRSTKLCCQTI